MSAMGERFLLLEGTADALDVIDPELAVQFRIVNGLPDRPRAEPASGPPVSERPADRHEIRMDVGDRQIRCDCSCGAWHAEVDLAEIDTMVAQVRGHLGRFDATSDDGITTAAPSRPAASERRVG